MSWKKNEEEIYNDIKMNYSTENTKFIHEGGSDSTEPDIKVFINKKNKFNIEVKSKKSQAGQFVVLDECGVFIPSAQNKTEVNSYSEYLISHMNKNYKLFKDTGTASVKLQGKEVQENAIGWIKDYYTNIKKSPYFAFKAKNKVHIIKTDNLDKYFVIEANYRIKRSGSSDLPKKNIIEVENYFKNTFSADSTIATIDGKSYLRTNESLPVKSTLKTDFGYEIYISNFTNKGYLIKKLSNTFNRNVIFSIKHNGEIPPDDILLSALKEH